MTKIVCPYCEQDWVKRISIKGQKPNQFKMCFECDTIWQSDENIEYGTGKNFESFCDLLGIKPDWGNISEIGFAEKHTDD